MRGIYVIEKELGELYRELDMVQEMSEESVMQKYNSDSKEDIIDIINDDIQALEKELNETEEYLHRERNYEKTADKPYICW